MGNVEGTQVTRGDADVIVCDGFTGNVAVKLIEGTSQSTVDAIRAVARSTPVAMAGGLLLRPALRRLGVVPHGRFTREGFAQAVLRAARGVEGDLVGRTHAALERAGALRRVPASEAVSSLSSP